MFITGTAIVEEYADWFADKVRKSVDSSVVLAGYSMGATIAVVVATRHPELVERLVLAAGVTRWGGGVRSLAAAFPGLTARFLKARAKGELRKLLDDGEERRLMYEMFSGADMATMAALVAQLLSSDFGKYASAVRCPTLIVSGEGDVLADRGRIAETKRLIPGAAAVEIPGANHYFCVTHAKMLARELISFGAGRK